MPFGWMDEFMRLGEVWGFGVLEFGVWRYRDKVLSNCCASSQCLKV